MVGAGTACVGMGTGGPWGGESRGSCGTASSSDRPARSRPHAVSCIDDARPCLAFPRGINLSHSPSGPPLKRRRTCLTQIGRAHVSTPVTNAYLVCRFLLEKQTPFLYTFIDSCEILTT